MSSYVLTFHGTRCPDGAELIAAEPGTDGPTILSGTPSWSERIRYRSKERVPYSRRLETPDEPLVLEFLNTYALPTSALVDFVAQHGLIFEQSLGRPDELEINYIRHLQTWLSIVMEAYERGDLSAARSRFRKLSKSQLAALRPDMTMRGAGLALTLPIDTLFGFMLMETALIMTGGSQVMRCSHCSNVFISGSGTGRRNTSLYCSNRCRVAAQRAARNKGRHT